MSEDVEKIALELCVTLGIGREELRLFAARGVRHGDQRPVLGRGVRARDQPGRGARAPADVFHVQLDVRWGVHGQILR